MADIKEKLVGLLYNSPQLDVLGGLSYYEEAADHLIANGVTIQEWISVEERLPKPGQLVLVYCRSQMVKKHITVSTYTGDYSYTRRCRWSRRVRDVTHWMPLPEPPKEMKEK